MEVMARFYHVIGFVRFFNYAGVTYLTSMRIVPRLYLPQHPDAPLFLFLFIYRLYTLNYFVWWGVFFFFSPT